MSIKNQKKILLIFTLILSFAICFPSLGFAKKTKKIFSTKPVKNGTDKWRIGYYEGGNYSEYHTSIDATIKGLMDMGWIAEESLPIMPEATGRSLWEYYAKNLKSDYIEFALDGFYSAQWRPEKRKELQTDIIQRLNKTKNLDLMIAMGTWAGIDLSQGNHQTPTIVLAVSDAVASGIIKATHDSGNEFIHARVDPNRYERQVRIFHTIIGFKTIGMIYRDNIEGRSYAAVNKVKKVARERGFKIQTCFMDKSADLAQDEERLVQCFQKLSGTADAIYVTGQKAVNKRTVPIIATIAEQAKIPTFSQAGYQDVKKGLLLSISQAGFKYVGKFYAETITKILNGARPGELNQIFEDPSKIAINLSTAMAISFYPSLDILSSADEIYREIPDENN